MDLGRIGVWSGVLRRAPLAAAVEAAVELDRLGYGTLWLPGRAGPDGDTVFARAAAVLAATERLTVATGIVSVWDVPAAEAASEHHRLTTDHPGRFVLGIGISHAPLVDREAPGRYARPIATMSAYLAELDAAPHPVPREERVIAALGPRMLRLARERSAGTHPYNVPPEHTRAAREAVGAARLVAPEQGVVLARDAATGRRVARRFLRGYFGMPNYTNAWMRVGFTAADLEDGGSDRLVDALIAWGDASMVGARIEEHLRTGADHVAVQALRDDDALPLEDLRTLAASLVE